MLRAVVIGEGNWTLWDRADIDEIPRGGIQYDNRIGHGNGRRLRGAQATRQGESRHNKDKSQHADERRNRPQPSAARRWLHPGVERQPVR